MQSDVVITQQLRKVKKNIAVKRRKLKLYCYKIKIKHCSLTMSDVAEIVDHLNSFYRATTCYRATLRYGPMSVCPSVWHKPMFYGDG